MIIITPTQKYDSKKWITKEVRQALNNPKLLCQFGNVQRDYQDVCHLIKEDYPLWFNSDVKSWRQQYRDGVIVFLDNNQKEIECKVKGVNRKFYTLCMSFVDETAEDGVKYVLDVNAQMLFGWHCSGLTYFFPSKANRDNILEWIKKPVHKSSQVKKDHDSSSQTNLGATHIELVKTQLSASQRLYYESEELNKKNEDLKKEILKLKEENEELNKKNGGWCLSHSMIEQTSAETVEHFERDVRDNWEELIQNEEEIDNLKEEIDNLKEEIEKLKEEKRKEPSVVDYYSQ